MKLLGSMLIGVVTAIAGIPVWNSKTNEINIQGTIVCVGWLILWQIIYSKIERV